MLKKSVRLVGMIGSFLALATPAFAEEAMSAGDSTVKAALALAIGFGLSLAAFGGALGQSRAAAEALKGIARNPGAAGKVFTPMLIGLALIESLVIYSLVVSFMLLNKF